MNCYFHILPGRIRIRSEYFKKNEFEAFALRKGVYEIEGVKSVIVNTTTGSILIRFDNLKVSFHTILRDLAQNHPLPLVENSIQNSQTLYKISIESQNREEKKLVPFLLKKTAQHLLGSLEFESKVLNILLSILLPSLLEVL